MVFINSCIGTDVVDDIIVEERLSINSRLQSLAIGDNYQFMANFFNRLGAAETAAIEWSSNDPSIISITADGLAQAHMEGIVTISAMFMGLEDSVELRASDETVEGANQRQGRFMGTNNYEVNGDFVLEEAEGKLRLTFASNFAASSGPGLFIYLSNQPNNISGGLELGRIQSNRGEQVYETDLQNAGLNTFNYVLVWCKPFGVLFGRGEFEN